MVTIYLKAIKNAAGNGYDLIMSDTNSQANARDHKIIVESGSTLEWELENDSMIQDIVRIYVKVIKPKGKVFKTEPRKDSSSKKFLVEVVETDIELDDKYIIRFIAEDGTKVKIDPYIRVVPPHP